jgi:hypothetical protein
VSTVRARVGWRPADPQEGTDLCACYHESAHVIVDRAFGIPVSAVWVRGEEGTGLCGRKIVGK